MNQSSIRLLDTLKRRSLAYNQFIDYSIHFRDFYIH